MPVAEAEKKTADKAVDKAVTRESIDAAHKALGTTPPGASGASVDMGPQDVHEGDPDVTGDAPVRGTQLTFNVGGKKPTVSGLRLVGGKVDVDGTFAKGEKVVFRVEAVVGEIAFVDQTDPKTGQVIGCERRHKCRITGVSVEG